MPSVCLADRIGDLIQLTPDEREALAQLELRERPLRRGAVLLREKDKQQELFVLTRGTMMSYVLLQDGSRQILRFHFPGDLLGVSNLVYRMSPETITALSDCVVAPFERDQLARLCADHPRLACLLLVTNQMERVTLTDRLAAIGRTSAKGRVAAVLLEVHARLRGPAQTEPVSFVLGLTQEEVGDATGLTAVHVNRMMRQLEDEQLIARRNGQVTLLDIRRLASVASFVNRRDGVDLSWLPAAR